MKKRYKVSKGRSSREFKNGTRVAVKNRSPRPTRGGTRL
jgi:hypothetical protein